MEREIPPADFDSRWTLEELLGGNERRAVDELLRLLGCAPYRLIGEHGELLIDRLEGRQVCSRFPLEWDLETIGWLECAAPVPESAAERSIKMLGQLMRSNARYLMAASLHFQVSTEDYKRLQEQNDALRKSEQRYRQLAQSLERKVGEQVAQIDSARRRLYSNEKLASVGRLASGMAHEINNPIGFIKSNMHTALDYLQELSACMKQPGPQEGADLLLKDFTDLVSESLQGLDRVAGIVSDLRLFSNLDRSERNVADVNQVINVALHMFGAQLPDNIELKFQPGELPNIACLPGHLSQAIYNLLDNAIKALPEGGKIAVATGMENDKVEVVVSDNGVGIEDSVREKMFDPFFSTREIGEGVGLGLTVCNDIINAHDGVIECESEPGKGSRFRLIIPVRQQ